MRYFARLASFLGIGSATVVLFVVLSSHVAAYTLQRTIATKVVVQSATSVSVTQKYTLTWDNPTKYFPAHQNYLYMYIYPPLVNQETDLQSHISNIRILNGWGDAVPFTKSVSDGAMQLRVPYYDDLQIDSPLQFTLSYTTDLFVAKEGGLVDITYAGLSNNFATTEEHKSQGYTDKVAYSVSFSVPDSLGPISLVSPTPQKQSSNKGITTIDFTAQDLIGKAIRITAGTERLVKFTLTGKTYATNAGSPDMVKKFLLNYIDVALPTQQNGTEFAYQQVYYTKIEPFPISLQTDQDGNIIARLPISATQDGTIDIEGYAVITAATLPTSVQEVKISAVPQSMSAYMQEEPQYWQVNDLQIQAQASKLLPKSGLMMQSVEQSLTYVSNTLSYTDVSSPTALRRLGAVEALRVKKGVCMEYADLLLTLLRAQGVPTRTVFGDGVGSRIDRTLKGIGHQWVGVWFPETGWIPVDPTWSDSGKKYIGYDYDHFVWYVASQSDNNPSGFACSSSDDSSPCHEAISINTEPADKLPAQDQLLTLTDIRQQVDAQNAQQSSRLVFLQPLVSYLETSRLGRMMLSKQGLIILFALGMYVVFLLVVFVISTIIKRKRQAKENILTVSHPRVPVS